VFVRTSFLCFSVAVCLGLSGCGSSSVKPGVGPITVTDITGVAQSAIKSLTVGSATYLDVTLTNDTNLLGADWTVSCGSALPPGTPLPPGQTVDTSCGYFTPIHTASCIPSSTPSCIPSYLTSAAGYVTYYTAPTAPPSSGTVTLYASASARSFAILGPHVSRRRTAHFSCNCCFDTATFHPSGQRSDVVHRHAEQRLHGSRRRHKLVTVLPVE
jgi:hypothetical protein